MSKSSFPKDMEDHFAQYSKTTAPFASSGFSSFPSQPPLYSYLPPSQSSSSTSLSSMLRNGEEGARDKEREREREREEREREREREERERGRNLEREKGDLERLVEDQKRTIMRLRGDIKRQIATIHDLAIHNTQLAGRPLPYGSDGELTEKSLQRMEDLALLTYKATPPPLDHVDPRRQAEELQEAQAEIQRLQLKNEEAQTELEELTRKLEAAVSAQRKAEADLFEAEKQRQLLEAASNSHVLQRNSNTLTYESLQTLYQNCTADHEALKEKLLKETSEWKRELQARLEEITNLQREVSATQRVQEENIKFSKAIETLQGHLALLKKELEQEKQDSRVRLESSGIVDQLRQELAAEKKKNGILEEAREREHRQANTLVQEANFERQRAHQLEEEIETLKSKSAKDKEIAFKALQEKEKITKRLGNMGTTETAVSSVPSEPEKRPQISTHVINNNRPQRQGEEESPRLHDAWENIWEEFAQKQEEIASCKKAIQALEADLLLAQGRIKDLEASEEDMEQFAHNIPIPSSSQSQFGSTNTTPAAHISATPFREGDTFRRHYLMAPEQSQGGFLDESEDLDHKLACLEMERDSLKEELKEAEKQSDTWFRQLRDSKNALSVALERVKELESDREKRGLPALPSTSTPTPSSATQRRRTGKSSSRTNSSFLPVSPPSSSKSSAQSSLQSYGQLSFSPDNFLQSPEVHHHQHLHQHQHHSQQQQEESSASATTSPVAPQQPQQPQQQQAAISETPWRNMHLEKSDDLLNMTFGNQSDLGGPDGFNEQEMYSLTTPPAANWHIGQFGQSFGQSLVRAAPAAPLASTMNYNSLFQATGGFPTSNETCDLQKEKPFGMTQLLNETNDQ